MGAAILAGGNVEEEHLWSCSLTSDNKEFRWDPDNASSSTADSEEDGGGRKVKPSHRLLVKTAALMPSAKDGDITMVQVESEGYNGAQVTVPICALKGGVDLQRYIDVLVPSPPATLKIVGGEGPIHLVGSHCVDYYGFKDEDDTEDEDEADEEMEAEESTPTKSATASKVETKTSPSKDDSAKKTPVKE